EHRTHARCGADGERRPEQSTRAAPPRAADGPRRDKARRKRQQTSEREPEDDDDEAGHGLHARRVQRDRVADEPGPSAERDEQNGEARHERKAPEQDPPGGSGLAEPSGLDRRNRGQIAWHEWQHAWSDERDHSGRERNRYLAHHYSNRASSSSTRRSSSASTGPWPFTECALNGPGSARPRVQRQAATPSTAPAATMPTSGSSHARRLKPCLGGEARISWP